MLVAAPARKFTSGLHVLAVPTLGFFAIETLLEVYYRDTFRSAFRDTFALLHVSQDSILIYLRYTCHESLLSTTFTIKKKQFSFCMSHSLMVYGGLCQTLHVLYCTKCSSLISATLLLTKILLKLFHVPLKHLTMHKILTKKHWIG